MRPYLTVSGYSDKYGVPESTVKYWIKSGKLIARKGIRPMLIPDDQPIPVKNSDIHGWQYQWAKEEK